MISVHPLALVITTAAALGAGAIASMILYSWSLGRAGYRNLKRCMTCARDLEQHVLRPPGTTVICRHCARDGDEPENVEARGIDEELAIQFVQRVPRRLDTATLTWVRELFEDKAKALGREAERLAAAKHYDQASTADTMRADAEYTSELITLILKRMAN